jgi:GGDEF domain-containing protein
VRVTCSVGLALHPRDGRSARELLRAADAAMYTHKRGRPGSRHGGQQGLAVETEMTSTRGPAASLPAG